MTSPPMFRRVEIRASDLAASQACYEQRGFEVDWTHVEFGEQD